MSFWVALSSSPLVAQGDARKYFSSALMFTRNVILLLWFISQSPNSLEAQVATSSPDSLLNGLTTASHRSEYLLENSDSLSISQSNRRKWIIGGVHAAAYGGTLIILNNTWYTGYARTKFQTFNDSREWLQVDKLGHAWGAYNATMASAAMWRWTGMPSKKAALLGAIGSTAFLTGIELMDAHSAKWGWSWSDMAANLGGAGLFLAQEYAWNEQRIQFKFSFHPRKYSDPQLDQRADDLFGKPWQERMLKDYNAQTYWLSANIRSFFTNSKIPRWLNVSLGYGADGMFGGFENKWLDQMGNEINRTDIPRKRQFYLAPDISFSRIPTSKAWLRTILTILDAFKFPAPALMIDSKGKFRFFPAYF